MLALQSHAIDLCNKAVKADRTQGEERRALYFYKQALEALMEWLALEPNPQARMALKLRIHGYITRAEELKAQVEPESFEAAEIQELTQEPASKPPRGPPPKPDRRRPAAPATAVVVDGSTTDGSSGGSSDEEEHGKDHAEAIVASVIPTSDDDASDQAVLELPPLPYDARPASPAPTKSGICPSCGGGGASGPLTEAVAALDAREAWLREWEAALTIRDAELRRRELALEAQAQAQEQAVEEALPEAEEEGEQEQEQEGVDEADETAVGAEMGGLELKEE